MLIFLAIVSAIIWLIAIALVASRKGSAMLQVLVVTLLASGFTFTAAIPLPFHIQHIIGWPLFAPVMSLLILSNFFSAAAIPLFAAIVSAFFAALSVSKHVRGPLRMLWPSVAVAMGFLGMIAAGEIQFHLSLRTAAARLAPDCLDAASFRQSLANMGADFKFVLHAGARKNDTLYGWSHRRSDFYIVPESARRSVLTPNSAWLSLPYPSCRSAGLVNRRDRHQGSKNGRTGGCPSGPGVGPRPHSRHRREFAGLQ